MKRSKQKRGLSILLALAMLIGSIGTPGAALDKAIPARAVAAEEKGAVERQRVSVASGASITGNITWEILGYKDNGESSGPYILSLKAKTPEKLGLGDFHSGNGNITWIDYVNLINVEEDNYVEKVELTNINEISERVFYGSNIRSIDLRGVEKIGIFAFSESELSGNLNIPAKCTVYDNAFRGCNQLDGSLTLGSSVKMADSAFGECSFREARIPTTVSVFDGNDWNWKENKYTEKPADVKVGEPGFLEKAAKITFEVDNEATVGAATVDEDTKTYNTVRKAGVEAGGFSIQGDKLSTITYALTSKGSLENKSAISLKVCQTGKEDVVEEIAPGRKASVANGSLVGTTPPASSDSSGGNGVPSTPSGPSAPSGGGAPSAPSGGGAGAPGGGGTPSAPAKEETEQKDAAKEETDKSTEVKEEAKELPAVNTKLTDKSKNTYRVTKKGKEVSFIGNKKKATVTIPKTVKVDGISYKVTAIEKNAFKNNKTIKKLVISDSVMTIGTSAFQGCTSLKTVVLGKNIKKIGKNAFSGCKSLKEIRIPKGKKKEYKSLLPGFSLVEIK
ncbi:MAG: leucine-rich repeat protein [Acetivibrio ethanolgignens]